MRKEEIISDAGVKWKCWKHYLLKKYIDTKHTDVKRWQNKPDKVRQEDWSLFVDRVSTLEFPELRKRGQASRKIVLSPHTTGKKGAAAVIELVWKENPDAKRTYVYVATHVRKDGTTPTEETTRQIREINVMIEDDPTQ